MSALLAAGVALAMEEAKRPLFSEVDKRIVVARYAECVLRRHPAEAASYVARLGSTASAAETKALADGRCLSVRRGAIPTALRLRGFSAPLALADAMVRAGMPPVAPSTPISFDTGASGAPFQVGECLTGRHADLTRDLLSSEVGSDRETQALTAMQPALASCDADKLPTFQNPSQVRGWAAFSYLRRASLTVKPGAAA